MVDLEKTAVISTQPDLNQTLPWFAGTQILELVLTPLDERHETAHRHVFHQALGRLRYVVEVG